MKKTKALLGRLESLKTVNEETGEGYITFASLQERKLPAGTSTNGAAFGVDKSVLVFSVSLQSGRSLVLPLRATPQLYGVLLESCFFRSFFFSKSFFCLCFDLRSTVLKTTFQGLFADTLPFSCVVSW